MRWVGSKAVEAFGDRADRAEFKSDAPSKLSGKLFDITSPPTGAGPA